MKEKLMSILKDSKIEDSAAKQIAEGVLEAVDAHVKSLNEARQKEEDEAVVMIENKVSTLKKSLLDSNKALLEAKEDFKKRFEEARQGVKNLIEEDYKAHKAELSQKTKLFVESKWKEIEGVVKEQIEREVKEDVISKRVEKISESIDKAISAEPKQVEKVVDNSKEMNTLKESISTLTATNKKILTENEELKKKVTEYEIKSKKPLKEIVAESKIGKVIKGSDEKTEEPKNEFLNEIVRLANYGSKI